MSTPPSLHQLLARVPDTWKGIGLMAISGMAFVAMHASVKTVSRDLPGVEIAFFRAFFGFLLLSPLLVTLGLKILATRRAKLHALRGALNGLSMLVFFTGVTMTPLAQLTALSFSAPIFATLLAMLFLGEKVGPRRWVAILIGFAGTLVILRPGMVPIELGPMLILGSAVVWAITLMVIKILTRTESSVTITFYASMWLTLICAPVAASEWVWPSTENFIWLVAIAALGTLGQTSMNQSLKIAEASTVLPVEFSKLIWAAMLGFLLFAEVPDMYTWLGAFLIFGSTTYIGLREAYLQRRRAAVDQAASSAHKPAAES